MPTASARHAGIRSSRLLATIASLCCALGVSTTATASDLPTWAFDPVHTRVMFAVSHAGFSQAMGTVSGTLGSLQFDPADWSRTRLDAVVPMQRVDMGDAGWNRAVLASGLLDVQSYPEARFSSHSAVETRPGQGRVCGELNLHGVTRPLCLDVTVNATKRHPMPPFRRTTGFSATARLSRSDFGIDAWPHVIGDEVIFRIEAEAIRARAPEPNDRDAPTESLPPSSPSEPGTRP